MSKKDSNVNDHDEGYSSPSISRTMSGEADQNLRASSDKILPDAATLSCSILELQTKEIIERILKTLVYSTSAIDEDCEVEVTLLRCVTTFREEHSQDLKCMMTSFTCSEGERLTMFENIAFELFEGSKNVVTWQRIICLIGFSVEILLHCGTSTTQTPDEVTQSFVRSVAKMVCPFIRKEGRGWESLCDVFPDTNQKQTKVWSALKMGAIVGLATAALHKMIS